jgi:hypothetical protein
MSGQRCAWPGCKAAAKRGQLCCGPDWMRLPKRLRDAIWLHYRPGQTAVTCTPEYRDALHEVLTYARRVNEREAAAEREAGLQRRQGVLF